SSILAAFPAPASGASSPTNELRPPRPASPREAASASNSSRLIFSERAARTHVARGTAQAGARACDPSEDRDLAQDMDGAFDLSQKLGIAGLAFPKARRERGALALQPTHADLRHPTPSAITTSQNHCISEANSSISDCTTYAMQSSRA